MLLRYCLRFAGVIALVTIVGVLVEESFGMILQNCSRCAGVVALAASFFNSEVQAQTAPVQAPPAKSKATEPYSYQPQAQPAPAMPKEKTGPDLTTASYGDWVMKCQSNADPKRCEVSQTIVLQGQQAPIALIAIGREKWGDPFKLIVQLPNNVTLQNGVKATMKTGELAGELRFTRCLPIGCFADMTLNEPILSKLKAQSEPGAIKFKDGQEREISLPLSLHGFGSAVEALAKS